MTHLHKNIDQLERSVVGWLDAFEERLGERLDDVADSVAPGC